MKVYDLKGRSVDLLQNLEGFRVHLLVHSKNGRRVSIDLQLAPTEASKLGFALVRVANEVGDACDRAKDAATTGGAA